MNEVEQMHMTEISHLLKRAKQEEDTKSTAALRWALFTLSGGRATPWKAIRAKCLECCYGSPKEVRECPCPDCPLYPYRLGRKEYTATQRKERNNVQRP